MGLWDIAKEQFLDVIEFEDKSNKLIVTKYRRENGDDELKQGSKVIVRESQCAVFLKGGKLADVLLPGTYTLDTENFPILTKLKAFPYLLVSPVIADLYFVSMRQFIDNKWDTKTAIIKKDQNLNIVRIQAFGKFAFRISDVTLFMKEIFGTRGIVMTYDIVEYLSSMVTETFSGIVGETTESIVDLAAGYSKMAAVIQKRLNSKSEAMGIQYSNVVIEGILLPEEVEEFVTRTGCDSLAIAIGTSHGAYKFKASQCTRNADGILVPPPLRFDVLEECTKRLPGFPIVLHGSSSVPQEFVKMVNQYGGNMPDAIGIPEDELRHAAELSVCKINIDSDIRLAMTANIRKHFVEHPDHFDPRQYLKPARQAVKDMVAHKITNVLGSAGKA